MLEDFERFVEGFDLLLAVFNRALKQGKFPAHRYAEVLAIQSFILRMWNHVEDYEKERSEEHRKIVAEDLKQLEYAFDALIGILDEIKEKGFEFQKQDILVPLGLQTLLFKMKREVGLDE